MSDSILASSCEPRAVVTAEETAEALIAAYIEDRLAAGLSAKSEQGTRQRLRDYCRALGETDPREAGEREIAAYLTKLRQRHAERALVSTVEAYVLAYASTLSMFHGWLVKTGRALLNPMAELRLPREPQGPPRDVLTIEEVSRLLAAPDTESLTGLRDRAVIELMYSSGARRGEVMALDLQDVSLTERRVFIRAGKGQKDRVVPVGAKAAEWLARYLDESRPVLERDSSNLAFFLTERGERLKATTFDDLFKRYRERAGIAKRLTAHTLRHTCATHLVQAGADPRHVQALLGHEKITTTVIYTHVAPEEIIEAHAQHHPRNALTPEKPPAKS